MNGNKWATYKKLELIPDSVPQPKSRFWLGCLPSKELLVDCLQKIWQGTVDYWFGIPEPRIWVKPDRDGYLRWYVYDPISGASACFASEHEVRIWLEERYNRRRH